MATGDRPVTRDEFHSTLKLLEEIRVDIKGDIKDLKQGQDDLSQQLDDTKREITTRQDIANGRTSKNEAATGVALEQVDQLATQLTAVQTIVASIKKDGCEQKAKHVEVIDALAAAGVVPDTSEVLDRGDPAGPRWTRRHKAGLGVVGIGGLGLGALLPHVGPFLHWLLTLVEGGAK